MHLCVPRKVLERQWVTFTTTDVVDLLLLRLGQVAKVDTSWNKTFWYTFVTVMVSAGYHLLYTAKTLHINVVSSTILSLIMEVTLDELVDAARLVLEPVKYEAFSVSKVGTGSTSNYSASTCVRAGADVDVVDVVIL